MPDIEDIPPSQRQHDVDNENCWCKPDMMQPCPECYQRDGTCDPKCWKCKGKGLVPEYADDVPTVVIHRDITDLFFPENNYD